MPYTATFSTAVAEDLQALITSLSSQAGPYNPAAGIPLQGIMDHVRAQQELGRTGVARVSPGQFGEPRAIKPVHNALDRLQTIMALKAGYATGVVELTLDHGLNRPADISFEGDRRVIEHHLHNLPGPLKALVQEAQFRLKAALVVLLPNAFRPDTLVLVVLLGRYIKWNKGAEEMFERALWQTTWTEWEIAHRQLSQ